MKTKSLAATAAAVAAVVLMATFGSGQLRAEAPDDEPAERAVAESRALYDLGQVHYQAGEYQRAASYFLRAYESHSSPAFLYNAAQAYRHANICDISATLYRKFLDIDPTFPNRAIVRGHIGEMDACVANKSAAALPPPEAIAAPPSATMTTRTKLGWASAGVGVVLIAGAGVLALDANRAANRVSDVFERGGPWTDEEAAIARRGRRSETLAWVAGTLGTGALVTGAVLVLSGKRRERMNAPLVTTVSGGAVLGWSWAY